MKRFALFIILNLIYLSSSAQSYGIINDKDGYVNVRKDKNPKSPIIGKVHDDEVFAYDEEAKSDWTGVFNYDGKDGTGFIYKNKITALSKLKQIKKLKFYKDSCLASNDTFKVVVKSGLFHPKQHKLTYTKGFLTSIDHNKIWGTDGELPKRSITNLKLFVNGFSILVPEDACKNLYEPCFRTLRVYFGTNDTIYIQMDNSDGAGGYSIVWIIKDGKYLKRYVDNSFA